MIFLNSNRKFVTRGITPEDAAKKIKLLALDVDGVLTDGRIYYGCGSSDETKCFDVKDGLGLKMLMRAGIKVGIISGRKSLANAVRAKELGVDFLIEDSPGKHAAMEGLQTRFGLSWEECAFVGDDLIDCETILDCGIGFLVNDCSKSALPYGDLQTMHQGGHGAIREICEWLLKTQEKWVQTLEFFHLPPLN